MLFKKYPTVVRTLFLLVPAMLAPATLAQDTPLDRWGKAVGGREKIAAIKAIYREGTIEFRGMTGTIKVWHTADGKYRKEEQIGEFALIETFDGTTGTVLAGDSPPRKMEAAELEQARSKRFANSNAMFFVFFRERHKGSVTVDASNSIVFKPEGGIEWSVQLDPQTWLPKTMIHVEGERPITVTIDSYETVDGIRLEKQLHRSAGDPSLGAVVRFTKTVLNPEIDPSIFSKPSKGGGIIAENTR